MGGAGGCYCVSWVGHDSTAEDCGAHCRDPALLWRGIAAGARPCRKANVGKVEQRGAEVTHRIRDCSIAGVCGAGRGVQYQPGICRVSGGLRDCEDRKTFDHGSIASISDFAFAAFIPIYFAVVGYRLDLSKSFSFTML